RPTAEFRDSSLLTLEIENGVQTGPVHIVKRKRQRPLLARLVFPVQAEHGRFIRAGPQAPGAALPGFARLVQAPFGALAGAAAVVRQEAQGAAPAAGADLQALVVDVLPSDHMRQLAGNLLAVLDAIPFGALDDHMPKP